jgi:hypothetical protein
MTEVVDPRRDAVSMQASRRSELRRITAELAKVGPVLPGSVLRRYTRCGREGCKCMADPPQRHGPYWSWTRKVRAKTVTRYLSEDQYEDYREMFDNAKRLRSLCDELESVSLAIVEDDPRWQK